MLGQIDREIVLQLVAVIEQLVVWRERLESEGRVIRAALQNLDQREPRSCDILAAFIASVVADDEVVGLIGERRVPLADNGSNVLKNRVVRVGEIQRRQVAAPVAQTQ